MWLALLTFAPMSGLKKAIEAVGGGAELARQLNVKRQAIYQWREAPPLRVLDIERITGVSRHELRPDIYGPPPQTAASALQLVNGGVEGGAGEAVAGHDASLADGSPAVTANASGGFA